MRDYNTMESVVDALIEDNIKILGPNEDGEYYYDYVGLHGSWRCILKLDEVRNVLTVFTLLRFDAALCMEAELLRFINQCNYYLYRGCWVLDPDKEILHFRIENHELYGANIKQEFRDMLYYCCNIMDDFFPGFQVLTKSDGNAKAAMAAVEKAMASYDVVM